jgi:hypothetical protein
MRKRLWNGIFTAKKKGFSNAGFVAAKKRSSKAPAAVDSPIEQDSGQKSCSMAHIGND